MQLSVPQKHLGPLTFFLVVMGINLVAILSIDMYVPALPGMQREFGVTAEFLNLTLFAFFVVSAISVLFCGPISDKVGRKPLLIGACVVFSLSSFACFLAPSIELLILFRVGEALGLGCITTLSTALIQDAYQGESLKLAMTSLQSLIIIGPVAAPFLGTFILSVSSWRYIFAALAACGILCCGAALLVTETLGNARNSEAVLLDNNAFEPSPTSSASPIRDLFSSMGELIKQRRFLCLSLYMGVAGLPYFAFIAVCSYILLDYFATSYLEYSLLYAAACLITVAAPYVYMALSKRMSTESLLRFSLVLTCASLALTVGVGAASPVLFLLAFAPYALMEGIVRPMSFVELLDQPPHRVGAASSFANFSYSMITSLATVIATLDWPTFIVGLIVIMAATLVLMCVLYLSGLRNR